MSHIENAVRMGSSYKTIPEMLLGPAVSHGNKQALNDRHDGSWNPVSISETVRHVTYLAAALAERMPEPGASIGILAAPSSRWLIADMAAMLAGHVAVPFFVDFSESHLMHKVKDADIKTVFVFGKDLWARLGKHADQFDLVITDQVREGGSSVVHIDEMYCRGAQRLAGDPALMDQLLQRIKPDDIAVIIYTSGSTGTPKGVELTHRNLTEQLHHIENLFPVRPCRDRALSLLPIAHSFERIVIYLYLARGMSVYFVDDVDQLGLLMQETRPTMMTVVPRLLERTYERIAEKSNMVFGTMGKLARWTWKHASRDDEAPGFSLSNLVSDALVGWQIRKSLGGSLRTMVVGGAHMPEKLHHFYVRMGVPLYEGYGLTEASPVISTNYPGHRRIGSVGRPLACVEVRLSETNEVWARGPTIMRGYHNLPEETARMLDAEGWLHTGDLGRIDADGYLSIVARQKEMFKTSTGEIVSPLPIEQALSRSDLIEMACVIAEGRKNTSVLVFLNKNALALFKQQVGDGHVADEDFVRSPELHDRIQAIIKEVNTGLNQWERVCNYALLLDAPTVEDNLLTPTLKIRRHKVEERYAAVIEAMYDKRNETEDLNEFAIGHC